MDPNMQTQVRVSMRSTALAEATRMTVLDGERHQIFLVLDMPPPVGSVLTIQHGEQSQTVEVTHVVEVPEADGGKTRGVYAKDASEAALERHGHVGSESILPSGDEGNEDSGGSDGAGNRAPSGYAVPAPVVDPEGAEEKAESADEGAEDGPQDSMAASQIAGENDSGAGGSSKGKRRKGRRRR